MKKILAFASLLAFLASVPVSAEELSTSIQPRASICSSCGRTGVNPYGQVYVKMLVETEVPCIHGYNGVDFYYEFQEYQDYLCTYCGNRYSKSVGPVQSKHEHLLP